MSGKCLEFWGGRSNALHNNTSSCSLNMFCLCLCIYLMLEHRKDKGSPPPKIYIYIYICLCFTDYAKAFNCVDLSKLWKILKEMEIPDHLTCLLRNLYAGQEETVRTRHEIMDLFQIGKGLHQACYTVTLLIKLLCRAHHVKYQAGWITSWNQDCQEKYQ